MEDDLFEAIQFVDRKYSDDISEWPEMVRLSSYAARDRLLKRESGISVASERSYCIDSGDERWPSEAPARFTHALIYEVKFIGGSDSQR